MFNNVETTIKYFKVLGTIGTVSEEGGPNVYQFATHVFVSHAFIYQLSTTTELAYAIYEMS